MTSELAEQVPTIELYRVGVAHTVRMWSFLKAVKNREHRVAPTTAIAAIAAVIYTFAPIDLIPELVLGPLGFVDDIGLWGIFAVLFAREQHRWQAGQAGQ
jgi:uncharacterized membrane protein YkvA (DUF1232 family)